MHPLRSPKTAEDLTQCGSSACHSLPSRPYICHELNHRKRESVRVSLSTAMYLLTAHDVPHAPEFFDLTPAEEPEIFRDLSLTKKWDGQKTWHFDLLGFNDAWTPNLGKQAAWLLQWRSENTDEEKNIHNSSNCCQKYLLGSGRGCCVGNVGRTGILESVRKKMWLA